MARQLGNNGGWDVIDKKERVVVVTRGESIFIRDALRQLQREIQQEIDTVGDDEGGMSDAYVRILEKIIPKFNVEVQSSGINDLYDKHNREDEHEQTH
tara:strand:+ start:32 stop:325 length:294 start_codon:yes stop_codon:yes gene_type:complete